jgi:ParB-like chromosome segregation protein Spo0J
MSLVGNLKAGAAAIATPQPAQPVPASKSVEELSPHPLSEIFPPMSGEEIEALKVDIQINGLKEPIWLFEGKILDGNNRYRACSRIGYQFKDADFRQFDSTTKGGPLAFVVSANLHRRHLNESQRAAIAARLVNSKLGYNQHQTVRDITTNAAAKMLGVSEATVKVAKDVVAKGAPGILEKVQKGELRLGTANQVIKKPKDQQVAELAKIKAVADQRKADAKVAKGAGAKPDKPTPPNKDDQRMAALDEFQARWRGLDDMQRKAF